LKVNDGAYADAEEVFREWRTDLPALLAAALEAVERKEEPVAPVAGVEGFGMVPEPDIDEEQPTCAHCFRVLNTGCLLVTDKGSPLEGRCFCNANCLAEMAWNDGVATGRSECQGNTLVSAGSERTMACYQCGFTWEEPETPKCGPSCAAGGNDPENAPKVRDGAPVVTDGGSCRKCGTIGEDPDVKLAEMMAEDMFAETMLVRDDKLMTLMREQVLLGREQAALLRVLAADALGWNSDMKLRAWAEAESARAEKEGGVDDNEQG